MKLIEKIRFAIFPNREKVTNKILDYYEKNPDELDLIINKEHFNILFLGLFFVIGHIITFSARIIQYLYGEQLGEFINTVVLDVISEVGIAIFGGAIVAYLIEFLNKRQYQQNLKFRNEIKAELKQRSEKKL